MDTIYMSFGLCFIIGNLIHVASILIQSTVICGTKAGGVSWMAESAVFYRDPDDTDGFIL